MNYVNLTPVRLGMTGTFAGRTYRVAGRVVMGMEEGGETYYWNEFHLVGSDGKEASLVYEVTENGGEWRLFTLFDPRNPMSVSEAASKRVGDSVNLDGRPLRVTLVDESRVYQIEGEAPEGVEVGDVARYFNAEDRNAMIVVSWTGKEIEYYRGLDLPRGAVAKAFGLESELSGVAGRPPALPAGSAERRWVGMIIGGFLTVMVLFSAYSCRPNRMPPTVTKPKTPPAPLPMDAAGKLEGATWRVRGHAVVEIAQVGLRYDRHEYHLVDDSGGRALLIFGSKPGAKDWILFTPFEPEKPLTPTEAAAKRTGDKLELHGTTASVTDLSRSKILQVQSQGLPDLETGIELYGFNAQAGSTLFLVRWNQAGITFYCGRTLLGKDVGSAMK